MPCEPAFSLDFLLSFFFWYPTMLSAKHRLKRLKMIHVKKMTNASTEMLKNVKLFFWPQKVEKTTLKSCSEKNQVHLFFLTALTAQMAQTEEFMFQNVAY